MTLCKLSALVLILIACTSGAHAKDPCDGTDHLSEVQCTAVDVRRLNVELDEVHEKALESRPEQDDWESRKTRDQLRKSQAAWLQYKEENCVLVGGLEGGSNLWVSDFAQQCDKQEIENRIDFLKRVANGEF